MQREQQQRFNQQVYQQQQQQHIAQQPYMGMGAPPPMGMPHQLPQMGAHPGMNLPPQPQQPMMSQQKKGLSLNVCAIKPLVLFTLFSVLN